MRRQIRPKKVFEVEALQPAQFLKERSCEMRTVNNSSLGHLKEELLQTWIKKPAELCPISRGAPSCR